MESAILLLEVQAGLLPGQADPEFTRRWAITSMEWEEAKAKGDEDVSVAVLLAERNGQAQGYAAWLMMQPDRLNWVRTDWVWV